MVISKYKILNKGNVYSVFNRNSICTFRGYYLGRYYNKALGQWYYRFKSLDGFSKITLSTKLAIVRSI